MSTASLILGILSLTFSLFAFFPCLYWFDFINALMSIITIIMSYFSKNNSIEDKERNNSLAGLIMSSISLFFIIIRILVLGSIIGSLNNIHK